MSEENQPNGQPEHQVDDSSQEAKQKDDVVAYSTYSKVMGTLKKRESELNEVRSRLENIELEKKQAEGNKDEVIQELRSKLTEAEKAQQKIKHTYAWNTLEGQIKTAAVQQGCVNPDKLIRLLEEDDLKAIEVGDDFRVNSDDLTRLVEKAKKDHSDIGLFGKKNVNVNDVTPKIGNPKTEKKYNSLAEKASDLLMKNIK